MDVVVLRRELNTVIRIHLQVVETKAFVLRICLDHSGLDKACLRYRVELYRDRSFIDGIVRVIEIEVVDLDEVRECEHAVMADSRRLLQGTELKAVCRRANVVFTTALSCNSSDRYRVNSHGVERIILSFSLAELQFCSPALHEKLPGIRIFRRCCSRENDLRDRRICRIVILNHHARSTGLHRHFFEFFP